MLKRLILNAKLHYIPRNKLVQETENEGNKVVGAFTDSEMSNIYIELAKK